MSHEQQPLASDLKRAKKARRLKRITIGSAIAMAGTVAFAVAAPHLIGDSASQERAGASDDRMDTSADDGQWSPDPKADYVPSEQVPFLLDTDPSPEEIHEPMVLTPEQVSAWESGDPQSQSDLASNVVAPRISYAIHELYDARTHGMTADVSWLTSDPVALAEIERIADQFVEVSAQVDANGYDWFGFDLCRSDRQEGLDPSIDICAPQNFPADAAVNFAEGTPIDISVTFATSEHDEFTEGYARRYELDSTTVRLQGDTLVVEPL